MVSGGGDRVGPQSEIDGFAFLRWGGQGLSLCRYLVFAPTDNNDPDSSRVVALFFVFSFTCLASAVFRCAGGRPHTPP